MGTGLGGAKGASVNESESERGERPDTARHASTASRTSSVTLWSTHSIVSYQAPDSTHRFLVADEVGLGKTLVARGVIAKAIEYLWDGPQRGSNQIDIVYICSNAQIARQNVRRLQIGNSRFVRADRLTLLPREIRWPARGTGVNYLALTPGTSFNLRSSMGRRDERVLLYHLVQRSLARFNRTGPEEPVSRLGQKDRDGWRCAVEGIQAQAEVSTPNSRRAFERRLRKEGEALRKEYLKTSARAFSTLPEMRIPGNDRSRASFRFIGRLRSTARRGLCHGA